MGREFPYAGMKVGSEHRMAELCPAFLIEDFQAATRDAESAVERLRRIIATAADRGGDEPVEEWAHRQPEWHDAQAAMIRQFSARVALQQTGLPLPADAEAVARRAEAAFAALDRASAREPHG
jgi:hypothetical protein